MVISLGPSVVDEELPLLQAPRVLTRAAAAMLVARTRVNFLFMILNLSADFGCG
jgi:hypothetical protein